MSRTLIIAAVLASTLLATRAPSAADAAAGPSPRERVAEIVAALTDYRARLEALLPLQERELARVTGLREQRQGLLERGIMSRKEAEETEAAVATAQRRVEDTRLAIVGVEHAMAEATTVRAVAGLAPLGRGGYEHTATLIRYNGPTVWSLKTDTARLGQFFATRFGRPLPVSAYGQTPLHDRMGLDHRDALDVAVHPDSTEGRALMEYLRQASIPFIAAWGVVPGSTSGAHIHVGQPSPRLAIKP
jgi:hypothetical protein